MKFRLHGFFHDLPPGPTSFPHVSYELGKRLYDNPLGTLMGYYDEYGPAFTLRFLGQEMVFLIGPEANQKILVTDYRDFSWEEGLLAELIPFIGYGLLTTDDGRHDRARKLLAPAFYPARIRAYGEQMVSRACDAVDELEQGEVVELHGWSREVALKIAGDVLLGMETSRERAEYFAEHFEKGLSNYDGYFWQTLFMRGPGSQQSRMKRHVSKLDEVVRDEIDERRKWPAGGESILDLLCHAEADGQRFSPQEIRDHLFTLLFAGHDTTAATVAWLFTLVCRHPDVYARLDDEIDQVLGDRPPTSSDLFDEMPWLDQVVKETLRLYPPAWFGPRMARKDFSIYGFTIPARTHVTYCSWATHRLPELFEDPEAFKPERFEESKCRAMQPGAYVPFGRGPRTCIGMRFGELEAKILTVTLMQRFRLELFPGQHFMARTIPTISPRHGVKVRLRPR